MIKFILKLLSRKKVHMLSANKLTLLKKLSNDLKEEIQKHHDNDPGNIDDFVNGQLYGVLDAALNQISQIEKNNNVKL